MKPSNTNTQAVEAAIDTGNAEQAAELAALTAAANEGAPGQPAAAEPEQQGPQPPSAAALQVAGMAVGMLRPLLAYALPALRTAPEELWEPIPEGVAVVLDHYGMEAEWMQSPWARLGFAVAPLAAFAAIEAMKQPPKAEAAQTIAGPDLSAPAPATDTGSKAVIIGAPIVEGAA